MSSFINDRLRLVEVSNLPKGSALDSKGLWSSLVSESLHGGLHTWANGPSGETEVGKGSQRQ